MRFFETLRGEKLFNVAGARLRLLLQIASEGLPQGRLRLEALCHRLFELFHFVLGSRRNLLVGVGAGLQAVLREPVQLLRLRSSEEVTNTTQQ